MSTYYNVGMYNAEITGQGLTESSVKKTPQFFLSVVPFQQILSTGEVEDIPMGERFERTIFRPITEKTIEYLVEDLRRIGFAGKSFDQLVLGSPNCCDMRGRSINVRCEHEKYEGKTRERWSLAWGGTGYQAEPMADETVRKLNALYGKQLKEKCGNGTSAKPAVPVAPEPQELESKEKFAEGELAAAAEAEDVDDIPF